MASGGNIEVAKAYVTIVPSLEGSQATITQELTGVTDEASEKAGESGGSKFGSKFASALKGGAVAIGAALATATGAAIGTGKAFISAANDVSVLGNTIDKESQKMNMSATGYQEWDFILEHAGASIEGMKTSMKRLTIAAEEGDEAFAALGISQEALSQMSPEDTWNATISALQDVQDEGERTALATQLLGKGAVELAPLFNMTSEETEALKDQVHDLGGIMSDEAVKDAATYQDELQNLNVSLTGIKNNMMAQFLPGMSQVMNGLAMVFSGQGGGVAQVKTGLQSIISNIVAVAPQFMTLAQTLVMSLLQGFAPLLPSLVSTVFSFINEGITTVVGMISELTPVIIQGVEGVCQAIYEGMPLIIDGLLTMITELVTWLSEDGNVETFINGIVDLTTLIVGKFSELLPVLLPAIVKIIVEVATTISSPENTTKIVSAVIQVVAAVVVALVKSLPQILNLVIQSTKNILLTVKQWGTTLITNIASWFSKVLPKIKQFGTNLVNSIKDLPEKFLSIGKNIVEGIWNGISNKTQWIKDKVKSLGTTVTDAVKSALGIKSPSRVFKEEVGKNLALGLGLGFEDTMEDVKGDMVDSMTGLTASMSTEVSAYGSGGASAIGGTTYNGGSISINVYGAEGQNVNDLANAVAYKLEEMTKRRQAVYG